MNAGFDRRGLTITELMVVLLVVAALLASVLPVLARGRDDSQVQTSMSNLLTLGIAHITYAMDHNGRQFTMVVDDLASYGSDEMSGYDGYWGQNGESHPPVLLGWQSGGLWGYWMDFAGNWGMCQPMVWPGGPSHVEGFGAFRIPHTKWFHDYVAGRFHDPIFHAPGDVVPYSFAEPFFLSPDEFDPDSNLDSGNINWSSYCFSPAAMFHPDVMRHPLDGGWQDPWSLDYGFESPNLSAAAYPDLKTLMLEHHWNQNAPDDPCNPAFQGGTYDGCEPYYFNHALASEPVTMFYDLSVRLLPNSEALAADGLVMQQTGHGLWSRDTPFGADGYFGQFGYDLFSLSHHILTTDGIRGRDTLADVPPIARRNLDIQDSMSGGAVHRRTLRMHIQMEER